MTAHTIAVPMVNANEDEVVVRQVRVEEGRRVQAGEILCSLETTKASVDVEAPVDGYVRRLAVRNDERVPVGAIICLLTATLEEPIEAPSVAKAGASGPEARATLKAQMLADANGIDISDLGLDRIVKESDVRNHLAREGRRTAAPAPAATPPDTGGRTGRRIVILGAGGHARVLIDLVREGYRDRIIVGTVDDDPSADRDCLGVPLLGASDRLAELRSEGIEEALLGVGAVTNNALRAKLYRRLRDSDFHVPTLIHPRAAVEPSARMLSGCQIFAGAIVGSNVSLGENVIVNSGAVVSHDCVIGSHVHITPGAILAGAVTVGENSVIGMGVTVYLGVRIGANVTIGNGVHIFRDVPDNSSVMPVETRS
ncbi:MAG TPA: NeuD/PglB/VioB family sugar acetyltransferase [Allosphingosinicella sp.]|nr:NeuD/PglB/VioB family sugar acetyltransferase [Allosphingosinicella sp.]